VLIGIRVLYDINGLGLETTHLDLRLSAHNRPCISHVLILFSSRRFSKYVLASTSRLASIKSRLCATLHCAAMSACLCDCDIGSAASPPTCPSCSAIIPVPCPSCTLNSSWYIRALCRADNFRAPDENGGCGIRLYRRSCRCCGRAMDSLVLGSSICRRRIGGSIRHVSSSRFNICWLISLCLGILGIEPAKLLSVKLTNRRLDHSKFQR